MDSPFVGVWNLIYDTMRACEMLEDTNSKLARGVSDGFGKESIAFLSDEEHIEFHCLSRCQSDW